VDEQESPEGLLDDGRIQCDWMLAYNRQRNSTDLSALFVVGGEFARISFVARDLIDFDELFVADGIVEPNRFGWVIICAVVTIYLAKLMQVNRTEIYRYFSGLTHDVILRQVS